MSSKSAPGTSAALPRKTKKPTSQGSAGVRRGPVPVSGKPSGSDTAEVAVASTSESDAKNSSQEPRIAKEKHTGDIETPKSSTRNDEENSQVGLTRDQLEKEMPIIRREIELKGLAATSTPAKPESAQRPAVSAYARSDSSLLRIQAQLRQAKAAGVGNAVEPAIEDAGHSDGDGYESDTSLNSSTRTVDGRRIILNEMPRQANAILQQAKSDLEKSGNLKREIRESVVSALQVLYEMVLKIADSRTLHMMEAQRLRASQAKSQERMAVRHGKALETVLAEYRSLRDGMNRIHKDSETLRQILSIDLADPIKTIQRDSEAIKKDLGQVKAVSESIRGTVKEQHTGDLTPAKTMVVSQSAPLPGIDRSELRDVMREVTQELRWTSATQPPSADLVPHISDKDEICLAVKEALAAATESRDLRPVMELCGSTLAAVQSISGVVEEIKTTAVHKETALIISSKVDEIKNSMAELRETTVETTAPIRMAVEDLRREVKETENSGSAPAAQRPPQAVSVSASPATSSGAGTQRASYREALMRPRYPIMVESADPQHSSSDVVQNLKERVDVIQLGIGVSSLRKVRNQKVVINCDSERDRKALKEAINKSSQKFTVSQPTVKLPLLKLIGVANDLSNAKLGEAVISQNKKLLPNPMPANIAVRVLRRNRVRNNARSNVILEVSPGLWGSLRDQELRIGYQMIRAVDQSPVVQCYRCLSFGHMARDCKEQTRCGYCSEEHDTRECKNRDSAPHCVNCAQSTQTKEQSSHPAYASECPAWKKWDRIARSITTYC